MSCQQKSLRMDGRKSLLRSHSLNTRRSTVKQIVRLYSERKRAPQKLDQKMSETQKLIYSRTLSNEEGSVKMVRSSSKDSDIDHEYALSSSKEQKGTDVQRRDSSGSSDSNASKKQASLNEIQDLYSALQDLVKKNVTTTPVDVRKQSFLTSTPDIRSSPNASPRLRLNESLRVNEPSTIIINTKEGKISQKKESSPAVEEFERTQIDKTKLHRRGHSAGNVESMKMKNSPLPNRRLSEDSATINSDDDRNRKTSRSKSTGEKSKKEAKLLRNSSSTKSEAKSTKRWKPKIFSRLRSKSTHSMDGDDDEKCSSDCDNSLTPPSHKNRRVSEASLKKIEKKSLSDNKLNNANNSCPTTRKTFLQEPAYQAEDSQIVSTLCSDNIKNINQLVASLNIDYKIENEKSKQLLESSMKTQKSDLDELSSWFENAAAEAIQNQAKFNLQGEHKNVTDPRRNKSDIEMRIRKGASKRSTVKRGNSTGRNDRKHMRKTAVAKNVNSINQLSAISLNGIHARSTPNLRNKHYESNSDSSDVESAACNDKTQSPIEGRRSINLDEPVCRLPKTPLFYVPNKDFESPDTLQIVNRNKLFDTEVFYTEDKSLGESGQGNIKLSGGKQQWKSESDSTKETIKDDKRPKSMFTLGSYIEFTIDTNNLETDKNANICDSPSKSTIDLCDVKTSSGIVSDKSLWNRIRNSSSERKVKTIMT